MVLANIPGLVSIAASQANEVRYCMLNRVYVHARLLELSRNCVKWSVGCRVSM